VISKLNYDLFATFSSSWKKYRLEQRIKSTKITDYPSVGFSVVIIEIGT